MSVQRQWSTGTKGVPREEREAQILEAATAEFAERGHAGASVQRIASAVGISRAMVHSYFATRDVLYAACVHRAGDDLVAAVAAAQGAAEPIRRASDTLRSILEVLQHHPAHWTILFDPTVTAGSTAQRAGHAHRRELARLGTEGTAEVLRGTGNTDPADAELFGRLWLGMVDTAVAWWLERPEEPAVTAARLGSLLASIGATS